MVSEDKKTMNETSIHFGGFWFHIRWNQDGTTGVDQHGNRWFNKENPIEETGKIVPICKAVYSVLTSLAKPIVV